MPISRLTNAPPTRAHSCRQCDEHAQAFNPAAALHIVTSNTHTPLPGIAALLYKAGLAFAPQPPPANLPATTPPNSLGLSDAFLQPQPHEQQPSLLLGLFESFAEPPDSAKPPIELGIIKTPPTQPC